MLITLGTVLAVVLLPGGLVAALLLVATARERARGRRIGLQVAVTDAIDGEIGAIVAPVVRRRFGGGWRVEVAVPVGEPAVVARIVSLAHAVVRRWEPASPVDVVLTPQAVETGRAGLGFLRRGGWSGRQAMAWTGTSTSRASW